MVKQWDSTLDGKTRDLHRVLDGQIKELDEPFEAGGMEAIQPGDFGVPAQDCNCRCCLLQRARWALGNDFTKAVRGEDGKTELVKIGTSEYNDFKKSYYKALDTKVIEGTKTLNGVVVRSISRHQFDRMDERCVSIKDVKNALMHPLHIADVKTDEKGRKSQRFIGSKATVNINVETGNIVTTWKTGQRILKKYKDGD